VLTSSGAVTVSAPRVNDKRLDEVTGERIRFSSAILPPWARKSPKDLRRACGLTARGAVVAQFGAARRLRNSQVHASIKTARRYR
jgi:hypothetical protein